MTKKALPPASILVAVTSSPTWVPSTHAAVLCQKPSGVIVVRTACKKKETPLDLTQFGAVGPKGDQGDQGAPGPAGSIEGAPAAGDLSGSYPAPTIAAAPTPTAVAANPQTATDPCAGPTPQTGVYCGTSTRNWRTIFAFTNYPGITFWRDRLGTIHLRGVAALSPAPIFDAFLFYLPQDARPAEIQTFAIATSEESGTPDPAGALLQVNPDGGVRIFTSLASSHELVHLGGVEFRTDG